MRRPLAIAALLLASCPPTGDEAVGFALTSRSGEEKRSFLGADFSMEFGVRSYGSGDELPVDPSCRVTAPSGAERPCALRQHRNVLYSGENSVLELTFTPVETGLHQVAITLTEGGGAQSNAFIGTYVGSAGRSVPDLCDDVSLLPNLRVLCDDKVYQDDVVVDRTYGELTAVAGDVVWSINSGEVRRFVDSGAGPLTPSPAQLFDTRVFDLVALLPGPDDVAVVGNTALIQLEHVQGVVRERQRLAFTEPFFYATRLGDTILTAGLRGGLTNVCAYSLISGALVKCREVKGQLLGQGSGGLWLLEVYAEGPSENYVRYLSPSLDDEVRVRASVGAYATKNGPLPSHGMQLMESGIWPRLIDGKVEFWFANLRGAAARYVDDDHVLWLPEENLLGITLLHGL